MDGLNKGLAISISGPQREQALKEFARQMDAWNIQMPPVEPLVLDFGLNEFDRTGLIEYWIANETEAGYCGKYLFVFDGQTCPLHRHRTKKETFFVVKGQMRVEYEGQEMLLNPGDVLPVETWKYHSFTGVGPALLLELSMTCEVEDNFFHQTRIPIGGNYRQEELSV